MTDIFTSLIIAACTGTPGFYNPACQKALQASYVQSGYSSEVGKFQSGATNYGKIQEQQIFGKSTWFVDGVAMAGIAAKEKKINLNLPTFGVCNKFSTEIQPNNYGLKFEWKW